LNRILINGNESFGLILANVNGGTLRNAIPREAFATVAVPNNEVENLKKLVQEVESLYKKELTDDQGLTISLEETEMPNEFIDVETLDNILNAIHEAPNGVIKMSEEIEGVVETSSNMAIIKSENGKLTVAFLHRSSSEEAKKALCVQVRELFEKYGAGVEHSGDYPGWQPNANSPILNTMKEVYKKNFGKVPEVKVIHAGLECGILGATYPNWDMISFGPTIRFPHSPDEKIHIESVKKFWDYLVETLKEVPTK
jgi:dipeptidase D